MSHYYPICECCGGLATRACKCSSSVRYFCDIHTLDHVNSSGQHLLESTTMPLSEEDINLIKRSFQEYQARFIQQVIYTRNKTINSLLLKIKQVENECSSLIKNVLNGEVTKTIKELTLKQCLPVVSTSVLLDRLAFLKNSDNLSQSHILKELLSCSSANLSSLQQMFSTRSSSSQTRSFSLSDSSQLQSKKAEIEKQGGSIPQWELYKQINAHRDGFLGLFYQNEITCIAVSDCNQYIASASKDMTIKVWQVRNYELIRTLNGHTNIVTSVIFLGNKIVSGSSDKTIKIWEDNRCVSTLSLHSGWFFSSEVNCLCASSCNKLIASGSTDKTVIVYSIDTNKTLRTLRSHTDTISSVAFSPDNRIIVSGSWDRSVKVWKTETGELVKTLNGHCGIVLCVNFSGKFVVSSSKDRTLKVWDIESGGNLITWTGHTGRIEGLNVYNNFVASICGSKDKNIKIWDLKYGGEIQTLNGHEMSGNIPSGSVKFFDDGRSLVSGGRDGRIKLWRRIT